MFVDKVIGLEIKTLSNLVMRNIDEKLSKITKRDYTKMQSWIISYIHESNRDMFQKDIEKQFKIRRSTATGILQLMEKNGYIERKPVEHDARLKKIVLTQKAIDLNEEIYNNLHEFEVSLSECLTNEEIETFFKITAKLKAKLENME